MDAARRQRNDRRRRRAGSHQHRMEPSARGGLEDALRVHPTRTRVPVHGRVPRHRVPRRPASLPPPQHRDRRRLRARLHRLRMVLVRPSSSTTYGRRSKSCATTARCWLPRASPRPPSPASALPSRRASSSAASAQASSCCSL